MSLARVYCPTGISCLLRRGLRTVLAFKSVFVYMSLRRNRLCMSIGSC